MSKLKFIHKETISGSTSTTNVTDVFTSSYDTYKIISTGISTVGTAYVDQKQEQQDKLHFYEHFQKVPTKRQKVKVGKLQYIALTKVD